VEAQVAGGHEEALARYAIVMLLRLPVVLIQPELILEDFTALSTKEVSGFVVRFEVLRIVEVLVALLTVGVGAALHVVLFEPHPRGKVEVAVLTNEMVRRVVFVLVEGRVAVEPALAPIAFYHYELGGAALNKNDQKLVFS
jgi:hypothetical protein